MGIPLLAAAALALAPAVYAWWTGRRILRSLDDAALPELVFARTRRTGQIACAAIIATALVSVPVSAVTAVMVLALLAVQYPVRRAIFEDSWSFLGYLRYTLASFTPSLGFWLFAVFAPSISIDLARSLPPTQTQWQLPLAAASGLAFALVFLFWHSRYSSVWLALHQGSPLAADPRHASLLPRFTAILDRSRLAAERRPTIHRYGAPGGRVTNAIALVSLRDPAVALSDTLLDSLDANEATAIFAHEIAHHEHYDVAKLRKRRMLIVAIALLLAVLPPAMFWEGGRVAFAPLLFFPFLIVLMLVLGASKSRAHETESDLRAVELTNDPDAVISALTKIHWLARLPRRWGREVERSATHPSLARRIQAIRARGAVQAAPLGAATVIRSAEGGACVVLADDRSYWFDGVPADAALDLPTLRERAGSYRAVAYSELTELHLMTGASPRTLRATDLAGKTWKVAIRDEDVARVQATLDVVDGRLGVRTTEPLTKEVRMARVVAAAIGLSSLLAGFSPVIALIALVALFAPTAGSLGAMSVMTAAWFAVTVGRGASMRSAELVGAIIAVTLAVGSAVIAWRLLRGRGATPPKRERLGDRLTQAALAASVVVLGLMALSSGATSSRDMLAQPDVRSLAIAVGGIGAALLLMRRRWERIAGGGMAALAVAGIAAGVVVERLWPSPSDVVWSTGRLSLVATVPIDRGVYDVELSPLATRYLTRRAVRAGVDEGEEGDDGDDEPTRPYRMRFTTGRFSAPGPTRTVEGIDAAMVGEDRLLVLTRRTADSVELRLENLEADSARAVLWRATLPALRVARLRVTDPSARWRLSGMIEPREGRRFVTLSGAVAGGDVRRVEVAADTLPGSPVFSYEDGTTLLSAVSMDREMGESSTTLGALSYMLGLNQVHWAIWRYDRDGRKLVARVNGVVRCGTGGGDSVAVCVETAASGTRAWSVSRSGGAVEVARISHDLEQSAVGSGGLVVTTSYTDRSLAVVDVAARRGVRATVPTSRYAYATGVRATPEGVAALLRGRGGSRLALYRLEPGERMAIAGK